MRREKEAKKDWHTERGAKGEKPESESYRNKLAVSCRGTGGEAETDARIPAKNRRWVEAYC